MHFRITAALLLTISLITNNGQATTLLEMDIDSIAGQAELIFQGTVITSESIQDINGQYRTYVTFQVQEVLKGTYSGDTMELSFLGGSVNGRGTVVSDLRRPEPGETGIYFVESVSEDLINPLLGWSQGHFLIQSDQQGVARVTTNRREPVLDIRPMSEVPDLIRRPPGLVSGRSSRAMGVLVEPATEQIDQGLTVDQFKLQIRRLLESRR